MADKTRKERLEELLAEDPNDHFLRYGLAMEYVSEGDDKGALRCFQELLSAAPEYVPAYHQAGYVLLRLAHPDEARAILQRGIAVAHRQGDEHAAGEMQGLLDSLG